MDRTRRYPPQPHGLPPAVPAQPPIASERVDHDRKTFFIDLKENAHGRYFRIVEVICGNRNYVRVPAEHAQEFLEALQRLTDFERSL